MACPRRCMYKLIVIFICLLYYSSLGSRLDAWRDCTLRKDDGTIIPHKVLLFIDSAFFDVYRNWMVYFDNVCTGVDDYKNLELVCMDPDVDQLFNSTRVRCSKEYSSIVYDKKHSREDLTITQSSMVWMKRLEIINILLSSGTHLILSDMDAFWLASPYPDLNKHSAKAHVVASRGWYPWTFSRLWGTSLCMGFMYIKASDFTIYLFQQVLAEMKDTELQLAAFRHYQKTNETTYIDAISNSKLLNFNLTMWQQSGNHAPDDQFSLNHVLYSMGIRFPDGIAKMPINVSHTGFVNWKGRRNAVTLLPEDKYVRNCANSIVKQQTLGRMRYPSSRLRGVIRERLAPATVAHCLIAPGDGIKKQNYLVFYTLWKLPYNLTAVINYIRKDIHSHLGSRFNRTNLAAKPGMKYFNKTSNTYVELVSLPVEQQQAALKEREARHAEILSRLRTKYSDSNFPVAIQEFKGNLASGLAEDGKKHSYYNDRPTTPYQPNGVKMAPSKFSPKRKPMAQHTSVD